MDKSSKGESSNTDSKEEITGIQFRQNDGLKYISNEKKKK